MKKLSMAALRTVAIPVPPLSEQHELVGILTTWDRGIRQLSDLIAAKLRFKQGLMQQLLTGKRRFKGLRDEWAGFVLGELFVEREETNRTDLPLLSIAADRGVIPREEIDRKDTSSENKSLYKRIAPGDIGYNTMRMWQGVSALSRLEGIVSPAYTICVPRSAIDAEFAAFLFKYPPVVHQFFRHSQGLVDDTLSLKFHHFAQIHVRIPAVSEQQRIVAVLRAIDSEVEILRRELDALKTQKKGLMQKLLTGQVRVKS
jgi:type I restriction enzyme S subunit